MSNKQNIAIKIILSILILFLVIELIPVVIGIVKWINGDQNAWGYILLPLVSIISTVIIMIPAIFISKSIPKNNEDELDSQNETDNAK